MRHNAVLAAILFGCVGMLFVAMHYANQVGGEMAREDLEEEWLPDKVIEDFRAATDEAGKLGDSTERLELALKNVQDSANEIIEWSESPDATIGDALVFDSDKAPRWDYLLVIEGDEPGAQIKITTDGEVIIEGFDDLSDPSLEFWRALGRSWPTFADQACSSLGR